MKKELIWTLLLLVFQLSFSQTKKQTVYMDSKGQEMDFRIFKSVDKTRTFVKITENDSTVIKTVFQRKNSVFLDSVHLKQLKMFLTKVIGDDFDENKNTMIHLYRANEIYQDADFKPYWNWIENHSDKIQSFLIGTKNSEIQVDKKKHIYVDSYDMLINLFFKQSEFKMNHIYIKPNGEIYYYFGGENILYILDWSV